MYRIVISYALILAATFTDVAGAQTSVRLLSYQQEQLKLTIDKINNINSQLQEQKVRLERYSEDLQEVRSRLVETEKEMVKALKAAENTDDHALEREATLVEIRFNRQDSRVKRYEKRKQESQQNIARLQQDINHLKAEKIRLVAAVERLIADRVQNLAQPKKFQKTQPRKREAPQRQRKEKQSIATMQTAAHVVAQKNRKTTKISTTPKPSRLTTGSTPTNVIENTVNNADIKEAKWPYLSTGSSEAIHYARRRLQLLAQKKAKGTLTKEPLKTVEIQNKHSFGTETMEYLGDNLYGLTKTLRSGRQKFTLFGFNYWHSIPKQDDNAEYRVIFDISSMSEPQLYLFRESLLRSPLNLPEASHAE